MTLLQVSMMLHYYAIAEPYAMRQPEHANSLAVRNQRLDLANAGLLEVIPDTDDRHQVGWRCTEKGHAYVDAVCAVQVPICKWVQP